MLVKNNVNNGYGLNQKNIEKSDNTKSSTNTNNRAGILDTFQRTGMEMTVSSMIENNNSLGLLQSARGVFSELLQKNEELKNLANGDINDDITKIFEDVKSKMTDTINNASYGKVSFFERSSLDVKAGDMQFKMSMSMDISVSTLNISNGANIEAFEEQFKKLDEDFAGVQAFIETMIFNNTAALKEGDERLEIEPNTLLARMQERFEEQKAPIFDKNALVGEHNFALLKGQVSNLLMG